MESKCKACGADITKAHINKHTGEPEDLCSTCLSVALLAAYEMEDNGEDEEFIIEILTGEGFGE